ncbi:MAG: hypothetical protein FWF00_07375 [Endomicrobia bacterium]|nr:hypothetical protein [Endomicrobiia bacterium]MCL2507487.1 hypothetical protein [Endomicrobiia bacterium]
MKLKKITLFFIALFLLQANIVFAKKPPTQPDTYNGTAPMARSMAMGGAGAAIVLSQESFYYNSANLSYMSGAHIGAGVIVSRDSNASPVQVAIADPSGQGLMSAYAIKDKGAFYWQSLSDSKISYGNNKIETNINALGFAAGKKSENGFSLGLNLNYLYGKIGESGIDGSIPYANIASGNGFSMDMSILYPAGKNVYFGMNFKNIAGFMFWDNYNTEQLPFSIRTGIAYLLEAFTLAIDLDRKFYRFGDLEEQYYCIGAEQYISGAFCVRGGVTADSGFNSDKMKYTYGFGIKLNTYEIAFAGEQSKIDNEQFLKYMVSLSASVY